MKNITFSKVLPMVAVIAALGAAILPAHKSGAQSSTTYHWFLSDGSPDGQRTLDEEITRTGCNGSNDVCAVGYQNVDQDGNPTSSQPDQTLNKN